MNKKDQKIKNIIKSITLKRKDGANKDISKDLYKMRYGSEWEKYYPT